MPTFDTTLISRIQQANDIVDVIGEHLSLKRKGREMVGLCPFHEDHRPSFNVNPTKQIFKCFACGAGGDVVKFIQMRENLSFPQALHRLADRAGIKIEPLRTQQLKNSTLKTRCATPTKLLAPTPGQPNTSQPICASRKRQRREKIRRRKTTLR